MNIYKNIEKEVKVIGEAFLLHKGAPHSHASIDRIEATPTRDSSHGEIATNAAMIIASQLKANPKEIAATLLEDIKKIAGVTSAEIAGPGFINLTLKAEMWQGIIPGILGEGRGYGDSTIGSGVKVNVEYVSANPTGPMHVGHGRGAVVGDALALLLMKAGYDVTREYYINDGGGQIDKLAESAFLRYREALGENIGEMPEGLYPGEYMKAVGEGLAHAHGKKLLDMPRAEWLPLVRRFAVDVNMATIREDLAVLGIKHDVFTSEQAVIDAGRVEEAVALLESKGLLYTGVLEPPKGKPVPEDFEPRPQLLFRATQFGDDIDRAIKKSDGTWAYMTPDIAYHLDKYQRGFQRMLLVVGADHTGYQKRIQAAVQALTDGKVTVEVRLCQLVKFMRNGEPLKMSKRAGTFVTVREVVDEVGRDVFRFIMLTRRNDQPLDFDFGKVMEQSKDNPVFYVQYAHARCKSVIRHAYEKEPFKFAPDPLPDGMAESVSALQAAAKLSESPTPELLARLSSPEELALLRQMAAWPRLVEQAAAAGEPHRVAFYLHELASTFHTLWTRGNEQNALRFLQKDDIDLTAARVALARALATVIASGLMVLGVEPVEEMRS